MSLVEPVLSKPGTRLRSAVCATEGMGIQAPAAPVALPWRGAPLAIEAARRPPSSD